MLEDTGFSRAQAETQVQILNDVTGEGMLTKEHLKTFELNTQKEFSIVKNDIKNLKDDFKSFKTEFKEDLHTKITDEIKKSEYRMVIKLGAIVSAIMTAGLTAIKFIGV